MIDTYRPFPWGAS